jgi:hypothetical protein
MKTMQEKVKTKIGNKCFENVTGFRYFVVTRTTHSCVRGEIRRLNWGNAGYHLVQNLLSCHFLSQTSGLEYSELKFCPLLYMGVKLSPQIEGKITS